MINLDEILKDMHLPPEPPRDRRPETRCAFCGGPTHDECLEDLWIALAEVIHIARRYHPENRESCVVYTGYGIAERVLQVKRILDGET